MKAVVLDSGAVTRLARQDRLTAARIGSLKRRGIWPPTVPFCRFVLRPPS